MLGNLQFMNVKNKHIIDNIIWSNIDNEQDIFNRIYQKNLWYSKESVSGKGSETLSVKNISENLPKILSDLNITTIVDAPCGDFLWMNQLKYKFNKYIGIDIVDDLIKENNLKYSNEHTDFLCANIINDKIPQADLILCRDCFIHLSFENIFKTIKNFKKSNSLYLLTTTYKHIYQNIDIYNGGFRKINLLLPPFNLKNPFAEIFEEEDKYLSMWRISDL